MRHARRRRSAGILARRNVATWVLAPQADTTALTTGLMSGLSVLLDLGMMRVLLWGGGAILVGNPVLRLQQSVYRVLLKLWWKGHGVLQKPGPWQPDLPCLGAERTGGDAKRAL